jgi:hypothetical protein
MTSYCTANFYRIIDRNRIHKEKQHTYLKCFSKSEHHHEPRTFDWFDCNSKLDGLSSKRLVITGPDFQPWIDMDLRIRTSKTAL